MQIRSIRFTENMAFLPLDSQTPNSELAKIKVPEFVANARWTPIPSMVNDGLLPKRTKTIPRQENRRICISHPRNNTGRLRHSNSKPANHPNAALLRF
jgi:hypothetical protein